MDLKIDDDLKAVAAFMQSNLTCDKLVPVAEALARLAPLLWGGYRAEPIKPLALLHPPIQAQGGPNR